MLPHHFPGPGGPHPGIFGPHPGLALAALIVRLIFLALFLLVPLIIGLAYIWPDARRRGQPGWLWALAAIFLSWFGVLAYLVVRAFTHPSTPGVTPTMYPLTAPVSPMDYPAAPASPAAQPLVEPPSAATERSAPEQPPASEQPPNEQSQPS